MSDAVLWNEIGNIYLIIGSPEDAIAAYTKAIEVNPDSGWAYSNLGHAYFLTGEFGHALFMFRKSLQLMDTPEKQAIVWNKIGDAYRALKDIDNAIQAYKKADDLDMGVTLSEENPGRQLGNLTNFHEMIKMEKKVPEKNSSPSTLLNAVNYNESSPENRALADGFQPAHVEKAYVDNYPPPNQSEVKPSVLPKLNRKIDHENTKSPVDKQQNTSRLSVDAENPPLPREKSLIVIPEPVEMTRNLSNAGIYNPEPEQIRNSVTVIAEDKTRDGKSKGQAITCPGIDDLEEILAKVNIYENITRANPTNDRGWDTLGKLYKALGRYKDAIGAYQKAIEMAPDREVYYYYLGLLFSVEQQHDEAIKAFQMVLQKNPDYVLAHSALAGVYHRLGLENKANHHIAIALPKMNNESTYNRACFYAICGDKDLAFEFLLLALKNKDTTIDWIKSDPDLDPIRPDPRYQELIIEKDQPIPEKGNENYYSSDLEGKHNRLLPILNHSLER
jgi:tetratricopeptide (TPR) repeat protein